MNKKTIAYARQSLQKSNRESSTRGQIEAIRKYCCTNKIEIDEVWTEVASGKTMKREKMQHLIHHIKQGYIETLIVWRLDRISRTTTDLLTFFTLCTNHKVNIISINDETLGYENSMDKFKVQILASMAELQRNIISENKVNTNRVKFQREHIPFHVPPFGYRYINKQYVVEENEAHTVREVYRLYTDGLGYKKISRCTEERPDLVFCQPSHIRQILLNRKYYGYYMGAHGVVIGIIPAIISQEIYEKAEQLRHSKAKNRKYTVLANLRKKIKCPLCNHTMTTYHNRNQTNATPVYACSQRFRKQYHACSMRPIPISKLESEALYVIKSFLSTDEILKEIHQEIVNKLKEKQARSKRTEVEIERQKEVLVHELAAGHIDIKIFKQSIEALQDTTHVTEPHIDTDEVTLQKIASLIEQKTEANDALWQLVEKVEVDESGALFGVYLKDLSINILNRKEVMKYESI
ncbi:recombinase family protein [Salinicoccus roseus]|uniref:recombinase family protein n=1 Tax=Salinicoccus roseus TaxID=45670 RepID=UPI002300CDE4|nr:recombinase family protein [Salinicoccus roseus]